MADVIQLRRDTAANWTAANPVLASGEFGYETDTFKNKMGNGVDAWNVLPYGNPGFTLFEGAGTQGYVPDPVDEDGKVLLDSGEWAQPSVSPVGGTALSYTWDSNTAGTDPGEGNIKCNNADQTLATQLYVDDLSRLGNDVSIFWENADADSYIGLWEEGNQGDESDYYRIVSAPVDQVGWWSVEVEFISGSGGIDNNRRVTCFFLANPSEKVPVGGTTGQILAKQSDANYDDDWVEPIIGLTAGKHEVVAALPGTPDENTIYYVTG